MGKGVGSATFDATTYYLNTSGGNFIAAPVAGFDVRGKGSNLQLLMLSCGKQAFANAHQNQFFTYEYNLGTAETWSKVPSKNFYTREQIGGCLYPVAEPWMYLLAILQIYYKYLLLLKFMI
jgi:hypothetical protein